MNKEKILKMKISHSVNAEKDVDSINYNGEVDLLDLEDSIKSDIAVYIEESLELSSEERTKILKNLNIELDSEKEIEPIEKDVFSPESGHGTVQDGVSVTEIVSIVISAKEEENKLDPKDFSNFAEFISEDNEGLFNSDMKVEIENKKSNKNKMKIS